MTLRSFEGTAPTVAASARIDPRSTVIGDVRLEAEANVWPGAVLRGDLGAIVVRKGAAIQDNAVCHADAGDETVIGHGATVAHSAVVHGATVGRESLIGMNAVVLDGATIGEHSLVAAGSVITEDTAVPSNVLVAGAPAEIRAEIRDSRWFDAGAEYVELAARHRDGSAPIDREAVEEP